MPGRSPPTGRGAARAACRDRPGQPSAWHDGGGACGRHPQAPDSGAPDPQAPDPQARDPRKRDPSDTWSIRHLIHQRPDPTDSSRAAPWCWDRPTVVVRVELCW